MKGLLSGIAEAGGTGAITPAAYARFSRVLPPYTTPRGPEEDRAVMLEALTELGEHAAREGVRVYLEPLNRYEDHIVNPLAQAVELAAATGLDSVRVMGDLYHMNIEESDPAQAIAETGDFLGYFHTGDSHRGYMGSGTVGLQGVFRALVRTGYDGPITFESFSSRVVGQPLEGILGIWRNLWEDSHDLAAHALMYTKAQLKAAQEAQKQAERSRLP
jgi:D-psicose/D-tagatose/L-ribulose 3-epimerase